MKNGLIKSQTGLLIVDVQERLFSTVDHAQEMLHSTLKLIQACQIFSLPIVVTEQYPQGLGETIWPIRNLLDSGYHPFVKTAFSCTDDPKLHQLFSQSSTTQWIVIGIEAHICVLQTAKGLIELGKTVVVPNDAISSRSIFDFSTAIAEMREEKIRISSTETLIFELLKDARAPEFKSINQLIKADCSSCSS